jgi:hypothetical protein
MESADLKIVAISLIKDEVLIKLPVKRYLAINIEGKIGQPTVIRTSSFISDMATIFRSADSIYR